jgi:hypothetical protein
MKAGYGEPLRRFFSKKAWIRSVVDFGHAKQIFEEADVFPCVIVVQKPTEAPKPRTARLCIIPREQLRIDDLCVQIEREGADMDVAQLGADGWQLEPRAVFALLEKMERSGVSLRKLLSLEPLSGIKTGLNEAYLIGSDTCKQVVAAQPDCADLLRPFLRGQDFCRWRAESQGLRMITLASSENRDWPWSSAGSRAEEVFRKTYPALYAHLKNFKADLQKRQDQGRYWWELRSCAYWATYAKPKIMFPEITWRPEWCLDTAGTLCNNTAYILPTDDLWVLAVANAPIT